MVTTPRRGLAGFSLFALAVFCLIPILPAQSFGPVGGCTFDIDCDDSDPCTRDDCLIEPGAAAGSGTCQYLALVDGQTGDCDDGLFCNGGEFCQSGECTAGPPATCCSGPEIFEACSEDMGTCSAESHSPGARCSLDGQCIDGKCLHCRPVCSADSDCGDGLACNGVETCAQGQCLAGTPFCGMNARCSEQQSNRREERPCASTADCRPSAWQTAAEPLCTLGRCCSSEPNPLCSKLKLSQGSGACLDGNGNWFAGDAGWLHSSSACGGSSPFPPTGPLGCPRYGSGIAQSSLQPPAHPVAAGPVSKSPQSTFAPHGPDAPLHRLGDDYQVSDGSHLQLRAFRYLATISELIEIRFDFLDSAGHRVGSVTTLVTAGTSVRIVLLDPPLIIPPSGYITAQVAGAWPEAKFNWHSAADTTIGTNDPDKLFVNDIPAANFMAPSPGILSFELLGPPVAAPLEACCVSEGACSELTRWACTGQGGHSLGAGTTCPNSACDSGACCDEVTGDCTIVAEVDCAGDFQGAGADCAPDCCPQPAADIDCSDGACFSGADNCGQATVHAIPELMPGDPPHVVTITGDNSFASSTVGQADSCFGPAPYAGSELGWFEAFHLTGSCTVVAADMCCSSPERPEFYPWFARDCSCQNIDFAAGDPNTATGAIGKGAPYCDDENPWVIFGPLGPGDYFVPVPSAQLGLHGPYQMHFTAEPCPTAACCLPDGTCEGPMHRLACDALGGAWLGPPLRASIMEDCSSSPCTTGSCCAGPGHCEDEIDAVLIDKPTCDGLGGSYFGGIRCEGGTCEMDPQYSCSHWSDCPGGECNISPGISTWPQPRLCPTCEMENTSSCSLWDNPTGYAGAISELSLGSGQVAADDFVAGPNLTTISSVCAWGFYFFVDSWVPGLDCGENVTADHFRVRVYGNSPMDLPDGQNIIGTSTGTSTKVNIANAVSLGVGSGYETYGYQIVLDTPITGLIPGEKYWLEIANELTPGHECFWHWSFVSEDSPQGNDFFARGSDATSQIYPPGAERAEDLAFCVDGGIQTPAAPVRPCCTCDGQCRLDTLRGCHDLQGEYHIEAVEGGISLDCDTFICPADGRPPNDDCEDAAEIYIGTTPLSTHCSTTDGYNPVPLEGSGGPVVLGYDVWYTFHAPDHCSLLRVSMCPTGSAFDSMLSIHSDGSGTCVCPTSWEDSNATHLTSADENCHSGMDEGGSGWAEVSASPGQCFMIRIGNYCWPCFSRGTGVVDISCGDPICGNNAAESSNGEECDGVDDDACPGLCRPPGDAQECTCAPPPECGNNVREGDETCDGTDSPSCPGFCNPPGWWNECTCLGEFECFDGIRTPPEECDGPADTSCGGVSGRCLPDCTCPPMVCGNDFRDPGEECDGTHDDLCPGECRVPGDPVGECTCRCPFVIDPLCMPVPTLPTVDKQRFLTFAVAESCAGMDTGLRVELVSLHHPANPPPGTPDFAAHEGDFRYVNSFGGSITCVDSATFSTDYRCGQIGCQPEYRDWFATLSNTTNPASAAGLIHVTGDAVVPSSTYHVSSIAASCGASPQADNCLSASAAMQLSTARWGDAGSGGGAAPEGAANVIDIGLVVDNVKGLATAVAEHRAWLKNPTNPIGNPVNVIDIGLTVDAVKGLPYPYTLSTCP